MRHSTQAQAAPAMDRPCKRKRKGSSREAYQGTLEKVKAQPKKTVQPKKAAELAKQDFSDDSTDDSSSDDDPANKPVACSNKPLVSIATNSSSSDESSSDEEPVKNLAAPLKKPVARVTNGSKKLSQTAVALVAVLMKSRMRIIR
ncbi:hypothetical protein GUJ93_ZPchr0458g22346 [Zizania palustris]|uniref:Uncharacterized protein n=1 Tax=Zizania palustris TaxID=103762 RepID=A0A8J5UUP3_ZIZPA|nr:hypothetical protein GUJ93_ZPchr0458g22346 [Zizania palustris]